MMDGTVLDVSLDQQILKYSNGKCSPFMGKSTQMEKANEDQIA